MTPIWVNDYEMEILCGYLGELLDRDLPPANRKAFEKVYEQVIPEVRDNTNYEMPLDITEELLEILESDNVHQALEELVARRGYDETKVR